MTKVEAVLSKFIYNDRVYDAGEYGVVFKESSPSVYEVIRIMDGVPLFLEEHFERLLNSGRLIGYELDLTIEAVKKNIINMVNLNDVKNHNIKIIVNNLSSNGFNVYYFFIKTDYPKEDLYKKGINTITYKATRENPNAKVIYKSLREEIDTLLEKDNCYEALLVNDNNEVTEGSRSNLFFIKDNKLFTAPARDVLMGITRERIISLCIQNHIEIIEMPILFNSLKLFDACFISGTSPKILPIGRIDKNKYEVENPLLNRIIEIYDLEIKKYILSYK